MPANSNGDEKKCAERQRGNSGSSASETGLDNRANPSTKGNKDCPTQAPPPAATGHTMITGTVFNDANGSGWLDADELPLAGWTLQLSGPASATATTDASGAYSFSGLTAGVYTVCAVPPAGWTQTLPTSGASCRSGVGYSLEAPALAIDISYSGVDFGFKQ
jgi:hypothetical protein